MATSGERRTLVLLALAALPFAFVNTLFTQTVSFAADDFSRTDADIGFGAAAVRWGVLIVPPIAMIADRAGRRKVVVAMLWLAPLCAALGAIAPSYEWLVATQFIARPLALVINVMILVILTEEMSHDNRARSIGYVAIASSIGAGAAVVALPLADLASYGWRYVYALSLAWLPIAYIVQRNLGETVRFIRVKAGHITTRVSRMSRSRLAVQISAGFFTSIFVGAASVYLVNYLRNVHNYDAVGVSIFTVVTSFPAGLGVLIGGRVADTRGRRVIGAAALSIGVALVATMYMTSGAVMWITETVGGISLGIAYPALGVYRGEMFPTSRRGSGAATVTASNLIGGSAGLIAAGQLLDAGWSYGRVMGVLALAPIGVSLLVLAKFPETVHQELEEISPDDVA